MTKFHLVLNEIAKHIDTNALKSMKYMCKTFIKPAKMEKIETPLEFLAELEECGKIRDGDVQFLINLLKFEKPCWLKSFCHLIMRPTSHPKNQCHSGVNYNSNQHIMHRVVSDLSYCTP